MSLYVKVYHSFWKHYKTHRAIALLGNDALWIIPQLWSLAAERQPDGDLSAFTDQELGLMIGYTGDASRMRQALLEAGFLDSDGRLHDWQDWAGYHSDYAKRASTAARARWKRPPSSSPSIPPSGPETGEERRGQDKTGQDIEQACVKHQETFNRFWSEYPKKVRKADAFRAWETLNPDPELIERIMAGLNAYLQHWTEEFTEPQYMPDPVKWLKGRQWEDDVDSLKPENAFQQ